MHPPYPEFERNFLSTFQQSTLPKYQRKVHNDFIRQGRIQLDIICDARCLLITVVMDIHTIVFLFEGGSHLTFITEIPADERSIS